MSNIVDAFSVTAMYNSIMKDCTESLMGAIPWGFSYAQKGVVQMGYRKVGYLEQLWYIIKYKLGGLFRRR